MEEANSAAEAMNKIQAFYKGIPDDSVDLTFKYLTILPQNEASDHKKKESAMKPTKDESFQISETRNYGHRARSAEAEIKRKLLARSAGSVASLESSMANSGASSAVGRQAQRKGIPHSNICALCDLYIFFFRHRCLVCGRAYCKNCVRMGMGEMIEGRKCIECLGRRFSQMYIGRAGKSANCCGYPSGAKLQELIWAEKGASRSCEEKSDKSYPDPNQMKPHQLFQ